MYRIFRHYLKKSFPKLSFFLTHNYTLNRSKTAYYKFTKKLVSIQSNFIIQKQWALSPFVTIQNCTVHHIFGIIILIMFKDRELWFSRLHIFKWKL